MLLTCNISDLNKAIQTVKKAITSKPSAPIYSGIHLLTVAGKLELQAMDFPMAISCTIPASIQEPGEIVLSAKYLSELIAKLASNELLTIQTTEQGVVKLSCGRSDYHINSMNAEDYPIFPSFNAEQSLVIDEETLRDLIRKTIYACAKEESRPLFTGILADVTPENITFVGTNTHRLAIKSKPYTSNDSMSMIIPAKMLNEIVGNLSSELDQQVTISLLKNQIMVVVGNIVLVSCLIEGKFPDYHRVIPPHFSVKATVNTKELARAVERVALFSVDGEYKTIKMSIEPGQLTITSSSPEVGNGKEIVAAETEGDQLNVAFNAAYILDILTHLEAETAELSLNTSLSPVCITSAADSGYTYIVTPVRVVF